MHQFTRKSLASLILLGFAGVTQAGVTQTTENITVFSGTKAGTALEVLREHSAKFGLPSSLNNLSLVRTQQSLLGTHYVYQQVLHGLPVDRAEIIVSIGKMASC